MALTRREAAAYLAGIIDGEGSVSFGHSSGGRNDPDRIHGKKIVRVTNTDPAIIEATCSALALLGISYKLHEVPRQEAHHRQAWEIRISRRDDLIAIYEQVPLQSAKRERLREALASYVHPATPPRAVLERLYLEEELSARDIGLQFGVSPAAAYQWLRRRGIQPRTLSKALLIRKARERDAGIERPRDGNGRYVASA